MPGYKSKSNLTGDATDYIANKGFYIEIYHINSGKAVRFKAFLKTFNDIFNSSYDDHFFIGQSEPIKKWKSTVRQLDLSFVTPATGISEARQNLAKVSLLTNMLYAEQEIDSNGGIITKVGGSPIFRIRLLNLIGNSSHVWGEAWESGLQGYISNLMYRIDTQETPFFHPNSLQKNAARAGRKLTGHDKTAPWDEDLSVYPQDITVSFTFFPVYERSPGWINGTFYVNGKPDTKYPYGLSTGRGEAAVSHGAALARAAAGNVQPDATAMAAMAAEAPNPAPTNPATGEPEITVATIECSKLEPSNPRFAELSGICAKAGHATQAQQAEAEAAMCHLQGPSATFGGTTLHCPADRKGPIRVPISELKEHELTRDQVAAMTPLLVSEGKGFVPRGQKANVP